ncbi:hypothetical protein BC834DRAFT_823626 [Gloeopeniophorella convolvens]|nr:hypothetical protein BC834DRAFT_823626 [Gloeopeniophorella convolvens]
MSTFQTQQSPRPSNPSRDADSARTEPTCQSTSGGSQDLDQDGYPPQRHAGAVGYGPEYNRGATLEDKMTGVKEEIRGRVTRNPEVAARGHDRRTGEFKKRQQEDMVGSVHCDKDQSASQTRGTTDPTDNESARAATVAPGGTDTQAPGMKIMDERAH